ncbi:MAG: hypothetical protein KAI07_09710 [Deltaproteobacteria bacterium]|nr:hypothetical protein [Deltaproteobacteria bacterium]
MYVINNGDDTISKISTADNTVVETFPVPGSNSPTRLVETPNGQFLYVTGAQLNIVTVIRTSDFSVVTTIALPVNPIDIAVSPDGNFVYTANFFGAFGFDFHPVLILCWRQPMRGIKIKAGICLC